MASSPDSTCPQLDTEDKKADDETPPPRTPVSVIGDSSTETTDASDLEAQLSNLPRNHRWPAFFSQEVSHDILLEAELLFLSFATGILDATTFAFYGIFVSKQTGNTICLALAALESHAIVATEPNIAMSIAMFLAGSFVFGHLGNWLGQRRRLWLLLTNTVQTALLFAATALRFWGSNQKTGPYALGVIALLSFASGGQISLALCVRMPELNTTMITGAMVQFAVDPNIFKLKNAARDRRVAFYFFLLAGGFVGAIACELGSATLALLLVAICKLLVTVMFFFNSPRPRKAKQYLTESPEVMVLFGD